MIVVNLDPSKARVQELEALGAMRDEHTAANARLADVAGERDNLRRAYGQLMEQLELLLFVRISRARKSCNVPCENAGSSAYDTHHLHARP